MRVLVNGSAAREGGALTILNSYVNSCQYRKENEYFVFSPRRPVNMPENVTWIEFETRGIGTWGFALFYSFLKARELNCTKIISFSNINSIVGSFERTTYVHNLLIFKNNNIKYKILRFILRFLQFKNTTYIVQTEYVKKKLQELNVSDENIFVRWPGVDTYSVCMPNNIKHDLGIDPGKKILIVPISDIHNENKNFDLVLKIAYKIIDKPLVNLVVTSIADKESIYPSNIVFVGPLSREQYFHLVESSVGVLVTSFYETVCLPIFESLYMNKKCYVYQREYISSLCKQFDLQDVVMFLDENEFVDLLTFQNLVNDSGDKKYLIGQWDF